MSSGCTLSEAHSGLRSRSPAPTKEMPCVREHRPEGHGSPPPRVCEGFNLYLQRLLEFTLDPGRCKGLSALDPPVKLGGLRHPA